MRRRFVTPALAAELLAVCACKAPAASRAELPQPPYEVVAPDQLHVRRDLFSALKFKTVTAGSVQALLQGHGRVAFAPNSSYSIRVPFAGFVEKVHVSLGAEVKAGQSLATLRSSELAKLRADARHLSAVIATESDSVGRLERLVAEGAASTRELVEAKGRLAVAQADLQGVQESLAAANVLGGSGDRFYLKATGAGQVLVRRIAPGERVTADGDEAAFVVGDPEQVVVKASFPERDAPFLAQGGACSFTVPALGSSRFEGTLVQVVRWRGDAP